MILEERDYRLVPGSTPKFLHAYETLGLPVQNEHLAGLVGYFTSEIGELNHVISMWRYANVTERETRRQLMLADPRWPHYLAAITGLVDVQSIRILKPTPFSPLR